jgi:hypothetical protein
VSLERGSAGESPVIFLTRLLARIVAARTFSIGASLRTLCRDFEPDTGAAELCSVPLLTSPVPAKEYRVERPK